MKYSLDRINEHTFIKILDGNSVILDLGANKGNFSKQLIEKYGYSQLILVEANPYLIGNIKKSFQGYKSVNILNRAVVGKKLDEKIKLYLSEWDEASSLNRTISKYFGLDKSKKEVHVETTCLEEIFLLYGLDKIDLLKMDIEGAECEVIENLSEKYADRIIQISVEFHDFADPLLKSRSEGCIKKLKQFGFSLVNRIGLGRGYKSEYFDCLFYKKQ